MKRILLSLTLMLALTAAPWAAAQTQPALKKANPNRVEGMKAALADIEKGLLKFKAVPLAPLRYQDQWYEGYVLLAKHTCGMEVVAMKADVASDAKLRAEMDGYNAMMLAEIERRFGKDILKTLAEKAKHDHILATTNNPILTTGNGRKDEPKIKALLIRVA